MPYLEMLDIVKSFSGVRVLNAVNFSLDRGEVVALLGQNGAGKSTLIKILSGYYSKDAGRILIDGQEVHFYSPSDSLSQGIRVIYQELEVFPDLSVAENIFMGDLPTKRLAGIPIRQKQVAEKQARELLELLGEQIDPDTPVKKLSVSEKQIVEIARALAKKANIIVMDEPTATLSQKEVERLFGIIRRLREQGVGIIYITHRLEEVFAIGDRVVVLRDGKNAGFFDTEATSWQELVQAMIGRSLEELYPKRESTWRNKITLRAENFEVPGVLEKMNFELREGEILGIFGLIGSGINELALGLFGALPTRGTIEMNGRSVSAHSPALAKNLGLGLIPADRKQEGIIPELSVAQNITMASLGHYHKRGFLCRREEKNCVCEWVDRLKIRLHSIDQPIKSLSGGNQQKVVLARWLATQSKVLIASEPTQGVDVGTRVDIYHIFDELARKGLGIMVLSSDLPEVLALSDTIIVLEGGKVVGRFSKGEADEQTILYLAMGGKEKVTH
jgi:ABC-type sugar transport system ATPase subunit